MASSFQKLLKMQKIEIKSLSSPMQDAMIQGNGDLHSIFYAKDKQIILRLAKK